jgi:hypothetical protein
MKDRREEMNCHETFLRLAPDKLQVSVKFHLIAASRRHLHLIV